MSSSVRFDDPPISNFVAGVMGNRLKNFLGCNGARPLDVELWGKFLAKETGRDEFARRNFLYQGGYCRWAGNSILPGPPKNRKRSLGMSTMASSLGPIFFSLFTAFCLAATIPLSLKSKPAAPRQDWPIVTVFSTPGFSASAGSLPLRPKAQDFRRELDRVAAELGDHFVVRRRCAVQSRPAHPLQNRQVRLYEVFWNARVGAPFNMVKLTAALYYKHFADKLIYSLPPGFDRCVHRPLCPFRSGSRCVAANDASKSQNPMSWTGSSPECEVMS